MGENPDGFPPSRVRLRRRRCSHSGISMGLIKSLKPSHAWSMKDKVATGASPVAPAVPVRL